MKKLQILTAAGILLALVGPSVAATRAHRGYDAYASSADRSGAYYYGPTSARGQVVDPPAHTPRGQFGTQPEYNSGSGLPYPDRPYGDPDTW